jgi:hypothetical protein
MHPGRRRRFYLAVYWSWVVLIVLSCVVCKRPGVARLFSSSAARYFEFSGIRRRGPRGMAKKSRYENKAWREWWSVHIEAWRRSGLSRRRYCARHRLSTKTFAGWLKVLADVEALRIQKELASEERRERRRRGRFRLSEDKRCQAVQAFWAMHVEAMNWSGMSVREYAAAHRISRFSLLRWRNLLDDGEVVVDWRATLDEDGQYVSAVTLR